MLQTFISPYVVKLLASDIQIGARGAQEALILLEYCENGHLLERLNRQNGKPFPINEIYRIFGQLLLAIQPMHDSNPTVIHRDLKLENILFAGDENIRLCDFGSCCVGYTDIKSFEDKIAVEEVLAKETTRMYRAPEMCDLYMRDQLTEKTDIWALGCVFYALCFLSHPFQDQGSLGILSGRIKVPNTNSDVGEEQQRLLLRMLDLDPEARPNVREIFNYVRALAKSEPTPPLLLTEEARKWKERRIEAEKRREIKAMKKVKTPLVPIQVNKNTTLDPNSAAARRLAVKRGNVSNIASETNHQSSISSPSSSLNLSFSSPTKEGTFIFDTNFDRTESPAIFDVDFDAAVKAASDFDQYFEFQSNMNEPSSSDPSMFTSVLSDLNEKLDVSILGASGRSSPAHSLDTSQNNSLIDLDF